MKDGEEEDESTKDEKDESKEDEEDDGKEGEEDNASLARRIMKKMKMKTAHLCQRFFGG